MAYKKQTWQNGESGGTPINATRLNTMEDGIEAAGETAADALGTANSASAVAAEAADRATNAMTDASDAKASAASAVTTANNATSTAQAATTAAQLANEAAAMAQITADNAQETANTAQETADNALTIAQVGGGNGGGLPSRHVHFQIPRGQVPANYDLKSSFIVIPADSSEPNLLTDLNNNVLQINESGYYEFNFLAHSKDKRWTGGWMAVKSPDQSITYATQDLPNGISTWSISGGGHFKAGDQLFVQFHPAGSGDFLNVQIDFNVIQIGSLAPINAVAKHAEAGYTYAQVHGNPWNAGLVMDPNVTNDTEFVTWGLADGIFTINETGVYAFYATVASTAAIGGTLGIGDANLTTWHALVDLAASASVGCVSIASMYVTAGTQLRFYYNCNQNASSHNKIGRVRVTQIAAQPRGNHGDPRGLVAWSRRTGATGSSSENVQGGGPSKPFLRLDVNLTPGRTYEVSTTATRVGATPGLDYVQMNLGYANGNNVPATVYNRNVRAAWRWMKPTDGETGGPLSFILPVPLNADPRYSILVDVVAIGASNLQAGLRPEADRPLDIYVHDIGPLATESSIHPGPMPGDNPAWNPAN